MRPDDQPGGALGFSTVRKERGAAGRGGLAGRKSKMRAGLLYSTLHVEYRYGNCNLIMNIRVAEGINK